MIVTQSNEKILRIVMDQWVLFSHHQVKLNIHRNVGLMRIFNILEQKYVVTSFGALMKLNGWKTGVIRGSSELFSAKSKFKELIERLTIGCSIYSRIRNRHKRQRLVQTLNTWKLHALFEVSKEQLQ